MFSHTTTNIPRTRRAHGVCRCLRVANEFTCGPVCLFDYYTVCIALHSAIATCTYKVCVAYNLYAGFKSSTTRSCGTY